MKTPGFSRVWFFVILFAVIVTAHIIILRLVVRNGGTTPPPTEPPKQEQPAAAGTAEAAAANKAAADGEKPGVLKRWFGGAKPGKPVVTPTPVKPPPVAAPRLRNRVPSKNPHFGTPLNYSAAIRGDLPERVVPGSVNVGTGIIVDMDTRRVLWEKNSRRPVPVASMVKMMTMLLVAEHMEDDDRLTLDSKITISRTVMQVKRTGVLWLAPGEVFSLRELLLGVAVKSANDAATQVAETVSGDVDAFVENMNRRAAELNLRSLVFYNPCGLPDRRGRNALGSAADMVLLGERLLEYPFIIEMCSTLRGAIRDGKTVFVNTNHLINPHYPGVDGLKTGFINQSGFCLTFSALRNGRRIMGCVTGFKIARDRDRFCRKLIDWAYSRESVTTVGGNRPSTDAGTAAGRAKNGRGNASAKRK